MLFLSGTRGTRDHTDMAGAGHGLRGPSRLASYP